MSDHEESKVSPLQLKIGGGFLAAILGMQGFQVAAGATSNPAMDELNEKVEAVHAAVRKEQTIVESIYQMHNRYDADGVPLWYVPRSWANTQVDMLIELRAIKDLMTRQLEATSK